MRYGVSFCELDFGVLADVATGFPFASVAVAATTRLDGIVAVAAVLRPLNVDVPKPWKTEVPPFGNTDSSLVDV